MIEAQRYIVIIYYYYSYLNITYFYVKLLREIRDRHKIQDRSNNNVLTFDIYVRFTL